MKVQRAKVYLTNGEIADIKLLTSSIDRWIDKISVSGIKTKDKYIPHHSITYILIEKVEEGDTEFDLEPIDVEPDFNEPEGEGVLSERYY